MDKQLEVIMNNFDKTVPFDPGFSSISFSFIENIKMANQEYNNLKANHQKKFWLMKVEPTIIDFINKTTAFYLGCILWGGFIHFRFKDNPKGISGNNTVNLTEQERSEIDCATEVKSVLEYIEKFNKDFKYLLKRPAKISNFVIEVLNNYIEFANINNNFINVLNTKDVKVPKRLDHFKKLSDKQLDELCKKIYETIQSNKIENLLDLKFYET